MYRVLLWHPDTRKLEVGDERLIHNWQHSKNSILWMDLLDNQSDTEAKLLESAFNIHPLAISDAQRQRHPAKFEYFSKYWFLLLKELFTETDNIEFATTQLAFFVSDRFLITRRSGTSDFIDAYWKKIEADHTEINPAIIALKIAKNVADEYLELILDIEEKIEKIEEVLFVKTSDDLLAKLVVYQNNLRKLIRVLAYQKQIFGSSVNTKRFKDFPNIQHDWNNAYEHSERAHSLTLLYHDMTSGLIDGYISFASHRLNQIMKVLTIITVIFVPLSFFAGVYGMNFKYIPELDYKYGYFILLGIMATIAGSLILLFKRKKWL